MANTITNRQMVFILFLTLTATTIVTIPKVMAEKAGVGSWITLLLVSIIFAVFVAVITRLNRAFPGRALYEYSQDLVGKAGCVIIAVFYIQYFLIFNVYLCSSMVQILKANFLPKTPEWAFLLAGIPVFGYMAYKGPTNVARLIEIYGVLALTSMIIVHTNMTLQGDLEDILPLIVPSEIGNVLGAMKEAIIAFLGIEVLTIMPFSKKNKKAPRVAFFTLLFIGLFYVAEVETDIMMLGIGEIVYLEYPLISALRQLQLNNIEFLRRLDVLYLTVGFMGMFAGISVVYLAVLQYISRLFPRANRLVILAVIGTAVFGISLIGLGIRDFGEVMAGYITYTGVFAAGVIPIILWTIMKVKRRVQK